MNIPTVAPPQEEFRKPFSDSEKVPSNWTVVSLEGDLYLYRNSVTNREEELPMAEFNKLLRG